METTSRQSVHTKDVQEVSQDRKPTALRVSNRGDALNLLSKQV